MKQCFYIFSYFLFLSHYCFAQGGEKGVTVTNKEKDTPTGKTWAVIVGISDYQNISKLSFAHKDAEAFYKYLRTPQVNVPAENIKMLLNKEAVSGEIYGTLEWLAESVKENDKVIFYFSGHGDVEKKTIHQNGFLLAYDAPIAAYMTKGTVSIKFLQDYLETYVATNKAKEVLLIVDACKSGKLAGGMEGIKMTMQALGKEWNGQITKILSAQEGELSLENAKWGGGRGVFSYYLMKGIQGLANRNADHIITAGELALYLPTKVGDETANSQNPKIDGDSKRQLFAFDNILLADAKKDELVIPVGQMIAANTKKGLADEIPPAVADAFAKYNEFVKKGWLLWGEKETDTINCALHIYNQLINKPEAIVIRPSLKSSFLTSLQKKSQITLDNYIKGVPDLFTTKDNRAIREIMFASTLVEKNNILYDYIKARALFFNSMLFDNHLEAIELLKSALRLEDEAAYIYNRIGFRYADAEMPDSAVIYYEKAKELAPSWQFPYNNLGIQYTTLKQFDKALENCEKGILLNPNYSGIYNVTGALYEEMQNFDKAIAYYEKAISLDSLQSTFYVNISNVYLTIDSPDKALSFALKATKLNPKDAEGFNNIGRSYVALHKYEAAIKYYKMAINLDTGETIYYNNLGNLYYNQGQFEQAIIVYKTAIKVKPQDDQVWSNLVDAYSAINKIDTAITFFKEYTKSHSDSYYPYYKLGKYYDNQGNKAEALKNYLKAYQFDNMDGLCFVIATINLDLNNLAKRYAYAIKAAELNVYEAYPVLLKGINQYPDTLLKSYQLYTDSLNPKSGYDKFYQYVGHIYFANKNYLKALELYEKGIYLNSYNLTKIYPNAIAATIFLKDYEKGIYLSNLAIKDYPYEIENYYLLASIYSLTNDIPNSIKYFSLSLINGFDDPSRSNADQNLINLRKSPKYKEVMKKQFPN